MVYRQLGKGGPVVSVLGYGGWALGEEGWPDVERGEALRSLEVAFECGVTLYDTAPFYGKGISEKHIGEVLASVRREIVLATKCGIQWDERHVWLSLSREDILREVEASLRRLRTDYIDLYQVHWYDQKTSVWEVCETLRELQRQGVIRYIGVCNFSASLLAKAVQWMEVVSLQAEYNLLHPEPEKELLPFCQRYQIGFIAYSPLAQGFLAGRPFDPLSQQKDVRKHHPLFKTGKWREVQSSVEEAFRFVLGQKGVSACVVSMTKPHHVRQNVAIVEKLFLSREEKSS
ncbi:MAG: aldo/keto reductase [Brevinematales bacterium]|nr:aldo/keto reductase [Brevinematales bacterium]